LASASGQTSCIAAAAGASDSAKALNKVMRGLSAIGCHTTLKANASPLDKAVFVADKVKWDQPGDPPYGADLLAALDRSLDAAAWCYLDYLFRHKESLKVVHPWAWEAYVELSE
jgi:HD superfamily phosphohydrolase YqeK